MRKFLQDNFGWDLLVNEGHSPSELFLQNEGLYVIELKVQNNGNNETTNHVVGYIASLHLLFDIVEGCQVVLEQKEVDNLVNAWTKAMAKKDKEKKTAMRKVNRKAMKILYRVIGGRGRRGEKEGFTIESIVHHKLQI